MIGDHDPCRLPHLPPSDSRALLPHKKVVKMPKGGPQDYGLQAKKPDRRIVKPLTEAQQAERESARQAEIEGMSYGELREQDIRCAGCSQSLRGRLILHTEQGPMHDACARDWFFGTGDRDNGIL